MKMKTTVGSYLKVSVTDVDTGKQRQIGIHNLVAETFLTKPENFAEKLEPNHTDGNKHNNRKTNLEWMTRRQNLQHAIDTGLRKVTDDKGKCLWVDKSKQVVVRNEVTGEVNVFSSAKDAATFTGIPARTVQYNAFQRKTKAAVRGFVFLSNE